MERNIREAKYVLLVCTEHYLKKVMGEAEEGTGLGIRWEGRERYLSDSVRSLGVRYPNNRVWKV